MTDEPLSGWQLNRAIAQRLGWSMWDINGVYLELHDPMGNAITRLGLDKDLAWRVPAVPDWAHDAGLALALCLELGRKDFWQHVEIYQEDYTIDGLYVAHFTWRDSDGYNVGHYAEGKTPAEALARLALEAIE
jgi:hypothetical protein